MEELQAREAASEGQLQQSLAAATEENRQLKEQLAVRMGWADGCAGVQTTEIDALPQYRLCSPLHAHQPGPPPAFSTYCRPPRSRPSHWASSWRRSRPSGSAWMPRLPNTSRCVDEFGAGASDCRISMHAKLSTYRY